MRNASCIDFYLVVEIRSISIRLSHQSLTVHFNQQSMQSYTHFGSSYSLTMHLGGSLQISFYQELAPNESLKSIGILNIQRK